MFRCERSPALEDGEIRDDADEPYSPSDYDAEGIISQISASSDTHLASWISQDDEREVDRIIAEMQGYVHSEGTDLCGNDDAVGDEEALRRAAIISAQNRRHQPNRIPTSASGQETYKEQISTIVAQETSDAALKTVEVMRSRASRRRGSMKSTWVRLDNSRSNAARDSRRSSTNKVEPLVVTVTSDTIDDSDVHLALHENAVETKLTWSKDYDEALHNIRMRFEQNVATAVDRDVEGGLGDNYEQVGMDIVDSDRDSQSHCAAPHCRSNEADAEEAKRRDMDEPSVDDEVERLRAALLEQVKRKKHLEGRVGTALSNREEGEVSSSSTPIHSFGETQHSMSNSFNAAIPPSELGTLGCSSNAVVPSSSAERNSKARSAALLVTPSKDSRLGRKRSAKHRRSNSSDNESVVLSDFSDTPTRKRPNTTRRTKSSGRSAGHKNASVTCLSTREHTVEEWERLLGEEAEEKRLIENKMRHRDAQRSMNASKRDRYLERAYRCCQQIGFLDSELMMLKGDLEKVKGRICFFEKECEKARKAESRREAEKKVAEKARSKEMYRRWLDEDGAAAVNVDVPRLSSGTVLKKRSKGVDSGSAASVELGENARDEKPRATGVYIHSESLGDERRTEDVNAESVKFAEFSKRKGVCRTEEIGSPTRSNESSDQRKAEMILEREQEIRFCFDGTVRESEDIEVEEGRNEASRSSADEDLENWCLLDSMNQGGSDVHHLDKCRRQILPLTTKATAVHCPDGGGFCFRGLDESAVGESMQISGNLSAQRGLMDASNKEAEIRSTSSVAPSATRHHFDSISNVANDGGSLAKLKDNLLFRQHESEYLMTDEEVLCSVFAHCPDLCPPEKMFSDYANELLRQRPPKPVGQLVSELLNAVPESSRVIKACDMASRYDPDSFCGDSDEPAVSYNIWPTLESSVLRNTPVGSLTSCSYLA